VVSGRQEAKLIELASQVAADGGIRPVTIAADLATPGEAARLAQAATVAAGQIDVLINNAGASTQTLTWIGGDHAVARDVFETNVWSPLALMAELVPTMLERGGAIVNVGSMARISPFPHLGHYSASRAALSSLTEVADMELGPRGVRVVEVALGPIDTPASRENRSLAGADAWLDGRPGMARGESAARIIAEAALGEISGTVFYPRALRWASRFPGLGRRYSRRTAASANLDDRRLPV
jgi:short-subunit dehydrogenase